MVAKSRRRKHRQFQVLFGRREIGVMRAGSFQQCIQRLGLMSCHGRQAPARRRCPGNALHGHIREDMIEFARQVEHAGKSCRMVELPIIGQLIFDAVASPPAITFREARPVA